MKLPDPYARFEGMYRIEEEVSTVPISINAAVDDDNPVELRKYVRGFKVHLKKYPGLRFAATPAQGQCGKDEFENWWVVSELITGKCLSANNVFHTPDLAVRGLLTYLELNNFNIHRMRLSILKGLGLE